MKVVITLYGSKHYSGLPKYFYFLAKHLALNDVDVEVVVDSEDRVERLREITEDLPISHHVIGPPVTGMKSKAMYALKISRYLKDKDFDVLHSCDVLPYFYLGVKNRKPVVFQPFSNEMFQMGGPVRRMLSFVMRKCGQESDALAVVGEWQMNSMLHDFKVPRSKAFVLPVGIDIDFVRDKAWGKEIAKHQLGLSQERFIILSVNILHKIKGIDYLIRALQYIPKALLIITSSGPAESNLKRLVKELDLQMKVIFTGNVPENKIYDYYSASDVYVHPTLLNGSSMGIMEAEVFGLPIVSTHQEFLVDGNGYVVNEKDPLLLAHAINKVRKGNRLEMGERSKEIVRAYDFKKIAKIAKAKYYDLVYPGLRRGM